VRLLREDTVLAAFFGGSGDGFEYGFDVGFARGGGGGEAANLRVSAGGEEESDDGPADRVHLRMRFYLRG